MLGRIASFLQRAIKHEDEERPPKCRGGRQKERGKKGRKSSRKDLECAVCLQILADCELEQTVKRQLHLCSMGRSSFSGTQEGPGVGFVTTEEVTESTKTDTPVGGIFSVKM